MIHGLSGCVEAHSNDDDFVVLKIDLRNAFNLVSRQAFLDECTAHFPEVLPWALWCYGQHPVLWHPLGLISSESGVQQGDPLGPLLISLVLHRVVSAIASSCPEVLFHMWYLDDGAIAGPKLAVLHALSIVQDLGPPNGLSVNTSKCELYSIGDLSIFPSEMKSSKDLNFEILGAPIGDFVFCAKYASQKRAKTHLSRGGLGLRSLSHHSAAAYISSVSASEQCTVSMSHLHTSVYLFNALIPPDDVIILDDIVSSPCRQHALSSKIENRQFKLLFDHSSLPDRANLLSVSSPNAAAWLSVIPSPGLT